MALHLGTRLGTLAHRVGDAFSGAMAPAVGLVELTGVRFPVKKYQAQVSDGLRRGSRLDTQADYAALQGRGVKSIVDLTAEGTADETLAPRNGFTLMRLRIIDNTAPTVAQMKQFIDFVRKPENQPVYVHCEAGQGRTGVAVACYRMAVQGWPPERALAEARDFGLRLEPQVKFIRDFGERLAAGTL